jgi:hypothetical protein
VFENRVLRGIFGPKRDEVIEGWRNLHNRELHKWYSSPSIIRMIKSRRMRWVGYVASMERKGFVCRILIGKPEEKKPPGRPRRRWEDNNKMDSREIGLGGMDWIDLARDRDQWSAPVDTVTKFWVPQRAGKFFSC